MAMDTRRQVPKLPQKVASSPDPPLAACMMTPDHERTDMSIYERLDREWQHAEHDTASWFHRHAHHAAETTPPGDTITPEHHPQGATMSLASIAADVRAAAENAGHTIEQGTAAIRTLLDQHLPQIEALGELIGANPVFASAEAAAHVPLEVLEGVAALLDKLAAAHPKPEPVAEVPAEPQAA